MKSKVVVKRVILHLMPLCPIKSSQRTCYDGTTAKSSAPCNWKILPFLPFLLSKSSRINVREWSAILCDSNELKGMDENDKGWEEWVPNHTACIKGKVSSMTPFALTDHTVESYKLQQLVGKSHSYNVPRTGAMGIESTFKAVAGAPPAGKKCPHKPNMKSFKNNCTLSRSIRLFASLTNSSLIW